MPIKPPGKANILARIDEQLKFKVQAKLAALRVQGVNMTMEQLIENLLREWEAK